MIFLLNLTGCTQSPKEYQDAFIVFGTHVNILVITSQAEEAQQAFEQIEQQFYRFNTEWHAWEKGGLIGKVNQAITHHKAIQVPASMKTFILKSQKLSHESNGLFDPGIGSLIALWGFHSETWQGPPPTLKQRQAWLKSHPSIADLHFKGLMLSSSNPQVSLDFGGDAKGLALDIAIDTLKKAHIENAIVNIGGDMRVIGNKNGQPWKVGITDPAKPKQAMAELDLKGDESVVTSGSYQRFFIWKGQRYCHIIDPNTAEPTTGFSSVTVLAKDATTADAAATAIMVAGPKRWHKIAQQMGVKAVLVIHPDGHYEITPSMQKRLKFL